MASLADDLPPVAATPRVDLAANGVRWHLHDRGLVVPVASEALRKYDLSSPTPWGAIREVDGRRGRELRRGRAELVVPWDGGGPIELRVRLRGAKHVRARIDGHPLASATAGDGWSEVVLAGAALAAGEHRIVLDIDGAGVLVHDVELAEVGAAPCGAPDEWPSLSAVVRPGGELGGWRREVLVTELPRDGWLVVTPRGGGAGRIIVAPDGATPVTLWSGELDGTPRQLSLAAFGGQLVRVELEADRCATARWGDAAIGLGGEGALSRPKPVENVVLFVVDTLRADRVAAMGPTRVETPSLTADAQARGVAFTRDQAMAPSSPPSHATIHTGQLPRVHGATGDTGNLHPDTPILSAILAAAGFFTGFSGDNGFAMDRFRVAAHWTEFHTPTHEGLGIDCAPIVKQGLAMAKRAHDKGQRFFISLLPVEPHEPYIYHRGVSEKYFAGPFDPPIGKSFEDLENIHKLHMTPRMWDQLRGLYDGAVEHVDGCYAALTAGLTELGVADSTAIVFTSDHGEGLGERGGRVGHAYSLHDELVAVPLVVLGGGLPAGRVDTVTSSVDIAPTVLDLLGLPADPRMQGATLLPLALRPAGGLPRLVISEYGKSYALRAGRWHYLVDYDGLAETTLCISVVARTKKKRMT